MIYKFIDWWEERRASIGLKRKQPKDFAIGQEIAFPADPEPESLDSFCNLAELAVNDPSFFEDPSNDPVIVSQKDDWLTFKSSMTTNFEANDLVWAKVFRAKSKAQVLVVFHHWGASKRRSFLGKVFSRLGITVVEIALPYHLERCVPKVADSDHFVSPNLGQTIQSIQQAVWDGRKLIRWLTQEEGYQSVSVLGTSLGSWVAALVAAHDDNVKKAAFFMTAGSAAEVVWTARSTELIKRNLTENIDLRSLEKAWSPINLENHVSKLSRPDLDMLMVLARRDQVILPDVSDRYVAKLKDVGARVNVLSLGCGHYSLPWPPYIFRAIMGLKRLLIK